MVSRSSPLRALAWFILTLYLCLQTSHIVGVQADTYLSPNDEPTAADKARYTADGANSRVHEVWSRLRDLEPEWKESVANILPSSVTGKSWYYCKALLKALFMNSPTRTEGRVSPVLREQLITSVNLLEQSSEYDDKDAIFLLAEMNYFGNFSHPRRFQEAFERYLQLADLDGNSTAQHMLGLMYATGVGGSTPQDQAKAMLYHTFAAEQGEVKSEMTLAFRYHTGIGTARDCSKAAEYYKRVADKAIRWWQSGPPGGHLMQRNSVRWVEYEGGSYGEGASVSSSGHLAYKDSAITASFDDVLEYLDMKERQGDWNAVLTLGTHYYEPPRSYKRNLRKAQRQFMKIARAYWTKDGKVNSKAPRNIDKIAGKAAAYIGRMFLRGEGMEQNLDKAITWFRRGVANGDAYAQYHIGLMYRDGLGLPKDGLKAATYLKAASEDNLAIAQSALGVLFLDQGDVDTAYRYFELAASSGIMEAYYYLAELTNKGIGRERNCGLSVAYYKVVAEKAELLHSSFMEANAAFERGDLDRAFLASLAAAEQGYESAQANVALLLDDKTAVITLPSLPLLSNPLSPQSRLGIPRSNLLRNPALAIVYFTRSAKQSNIDSLIKAGDYYLLGSPSPPASTFNPPPLSSSDTSPIPDPASLLTSNLEKASTCYTTAAESHHSAQALWNLGWMHENGIGPIPQDFHMAKRYYDLALEMNQEAYLPVKLALLKLRARSWWNGISGGKVNGIKDESKGKVNPPQTFMEWLNRFLDAAEEMGAGEYADLARGDGADAGAGEFDAAGAYAAEPGMPGGDADYYYRNGDGAAGAGGGGVDADYLDGDFDDGLVESLVIVALAGALALLVYARQQRQQRNAGAGRQGYQQQQVQQVQQDRAVVQGGQQDEQDRNNNGAGAGVQGQNQLAPGPAPGLGVAGDLPGFPDWGAGGIGH